jgi:putative transposase
MDSVLNVRYYIGTSLHQNRVKLRIAPMMGCKWFRTAAIVIAGIKLPRRIHKGQFRLGGLRLKDRTTPAVWNAVLAA